MTTKILTRFKSFALTLSYASLILAGIMFCAPKYAKLNNLKNRLAMQERENEACVQQIHDLKRKQDRLQNDPDFLIINLREILGFVGPYEFLINFHGPKPR